MAQGAKSAAGSNCISLTSWLDYLLAVCLWESLITSLGGDRALKEPSIIHSAHLLCRL